MRDSCKLLFHMIIVCFRKSDNGQDFVGLQFLRVYCIAIKLTDFRRLANLFAWLMVLS